MEFADFVSVVNSLSSVLSDVTGRVQARFYVDLNVWMEILYVVFDLLG